MRLLQEKGLQFPRSEHLRHDVTATYEFAVDVQLRNCRPIRVILDTLAQFFGLVDIVRSERNAEMVEYPDDLRENPQAGAVGVPFMNRRISFAFTSLRMKSATLMFLPSVGRQEPDNNYHPSEKFISTILELN